MNLACPSALQSPATDGMKAAPRSSEARHPIPDLELSRDSSYERDQSRRYAKANDPTAWNGSRQMSRVEAASLYDDLPTLPLPPHQPRRYSSWQVGGTCAQLIRRRCRPHAAQARTPHLGWRECHTLEIASYMNRSDSCSKITSSRSSETHVPDRLARGPAASPLRALSQHCKRHT